MHLWDTTSKINVRLIWTEARGTSADVTAVYTRIHLSLLCRARRVSYRLRTWLYNWSAR